MKVYRQYHLPHGFWDEDAIKALRYQVVHLKGFATTYDNIRPQPSKQHHFLLPVAGLFSYLTKTQPPDLMHSTVVWPGPLPDLSLPNPDEIRSHSGAIRVSQF